MQNLLFCFLITILVQGVSAQTHIVGTVVKYDSKKPLSFVNVGVIGKDIGTVSDDNGKFILDLTAELESDSIRFSMMGYKPKTFHVGDLKI